MRSAGDAPGAGRSTEPLTAEGPQLRWFVGRDELLTRVLGILDREGERYQLRASGTWGIGKSWLIEEIRKRVVDDGRAVALLIPAGDRVPQAPIAQGTKVTQTTKVRNFEQYLHMLTDLAGSEVVGSAGRRSRQMADLVVEVRASWTAIAAAPTHAPVYIENRPTIHVGSSMHVTGSQVGNLQSVYNEAPDPAAPDRLWSVIEQQRSALHASVVQKIDALAGFHGLVLLIDGVEKLVGHEVHAWLMDLVNDLQRSVVVIAGGPEPNSGGDANEQLQPFSAAEIRTYLALRFGADAVTEQRVQRLLTFSGGLPEAIAMAADLCDRRGEGAAGLDALKFDALADSPITTQLLSKIVREASPDLQNVIRQGRLARRLDEGVIAFLLADPEPPAGAGGIPLEPGPDGVRTDATPKRLLDELKAYSFVETLPTLDLEQLGHYRFHEHFTAARVSPLYPELYVDEDAVHAKLARYYAERRDDYEATKLGESNYDRYYKFEQLPWQALTREFLYHTGRLTAAAARRDARLEIAQTFFDTFWWWGCYVPMPFVDQILDDWERTQPPAEAGWSAWLRQIQRHYPVGARKKDQGDWLQVETALHELRANLGLDGPLRRSAPQSATPEQVRRSLNQRRVRAFSSLFLAHSYRFRTGVENAAIALYDDALEYMATVGDEVAVAWTKFEFADLQAELGDGSAARTLFHQAAELALAEDADDLELFSNLHRLRADLDHADGASLEHVLRSQVRALHRAFVYLNEPAPPDPYTVTFYQEQRERLAERLCASDADALQPLLPSLLQQLRLLAPVGTSEVILPVLAAREPSDVANTLTPGPPDIGRRRGNLTAAVALVKAALEGDEELVSA